MPMPKNLVRLKKERNHDEQTFECERLYEFKMGPVVVLKISYILFTSQIKPEVLTC